MSTTDNLAFSACQQLHHDIYDYIAANPGQPSRQIKLQLEPRIAELGLKNVSIQSFISVQKLAGLLEASAPGTYATGTSHGGPAIYTARAPFSYNAILDYEKFKRDNRAIAAGAQFRETFPKVPVQGALPGQTLAQKLGVMMVNHTPEVFMKALVEAIKMAY
jgi:hypothetical protein